MSFYWQLDHNVQDLINAHLDAHIYRELHKPVQRQACRGSSTQGAARAVDL
jgi:lysophospholipid acyltransferase (LPLAT)-like uncharacterized protein